MNLAETIYQKSKDLPEAEAQEVIDFIDSLKSRLADAGDSSIGEERSQRRAALSYLAGVRIPWQGKPIPDREALYDDGRD